VTESPKSKLWIVIIAASGTGVGLDPDPFDVAGPAVVTGCVAEDWELGAGSDVASDDPPQPATPVKASAVTATARYLLVVMMFSPCAVLVGGWPYRADLAWWMDVRCAKTTVFPT
jgi:hypothetical protein